MPVLSFFMLVLTLSSIGLPGLNGFVGEFLLLLGMFQRGWVETTPFYAWQYPHYRRAWPSRALFWGLVYVMVGAASVFRPA